MFASKSHRLSPGAAVSRRAKRWARRAVLALTLALSMALPSVGVGPKTARALDTGVPAPPMEATTSTGQRFNLQQQQGQVVWVDFWASWCGPCKEALPFLERMHQKYKDRGLVVVGVNVDSKASRMAKFLEGTPVTFAVVHDRDHRLAQRFQPSTMPTSYGIGVGGRIRSIHRGFHRRDERAIEARMVELLNEIRPRPVASSTPAASVPTVTQQGCVTSPGSAEHPPETPPSSSQCNDPHSHPQD